MLETICQFLLLIPFIAYFAVRYHYNYWKRKKIPNVESHLFDFDWHNLPAIELYGNIYRQLEGQRFGGCYVRFTPKLMVRDPELIKKILIKDFDHFLDRGDVSFDENEPITMHLFNASGMVWRNLRASLTPAFTSGKIKYMFNLVEECASEVNEVLHNHLDTSEDVIDIKDISMRYTIEVISSCAFGMKAHTIKDGNSMFKLMASRAFLRTFIAKWVIITRSVFPWLKKMLKVPIVNKSVNEFFHKLTNETVKHRDSNGIQRNDFLQVLLNMRGNNDKIEITNDLLTAQCFLFFVAGHDTSAMTLSGALYETAANAEIQNKLHREIDTYLKKYNNVVTYEMVKEMPYLHQVFSETLRKYPVLAAINRRCVENYQIPETDVVIEKGTEVLIPAGGLHWDPQYFPDPEKFDPDRFQDADSLLHRSVYLPFGDGPRNCIGSRFALMSVKLALIYILRDFRFSVCSKTKYPFDFERIKISTSVKHPIFLKYERRNKA
uniref:Cytochrome P450 6PW4 n=1 Tax=Maconellicoccus hirsutus TaxID=177089 RepID=A0AAT9UTE7_MACHI